jgi:hypothetical protein
MYSYSKERFIQNIKDCGQSIIDNAEKIAGDYKYQANVVITCYPCEHDNYPRIVVETEFSPEKIVERYM